MELQKRYKIKTKQNHTGIRETKERDDNKWREKEAQENNITMRPLEATERGITGNNQIRK